MTTLHEGELRSRPMTTLDNEYEEGALWFMTGRYTEKAEELEDDARVNLAFSEPNHNRYVSIAGTARLVRDHAKQHELWNDFAKMWFEGPDDPNIILLRVDIDGVEYWDGPGKMKMLMSLIKVKLTGEGDDLGENATMTPRAELH